MGAFSDLDVQIQESRNHQTTRRTQIMGSTPKGPGLHYEGRLVEDLPALLHAQAYINLLVAQARGAGAGELTDDALLGRWVDMKLGHGDLGYVGEFLQWAGGKALMESHFAEGFEVGKQEARP